MPMHHPKNYPRSTSVKAWGCPEAPLLHRQKLGHLSKHYIFIALCTMCFSWSFSCFSFLSQFSLFTTINGWTPTNFLWRRCTRFHLQRTLRFHSYRFNECSLFLLPGLVFDFCLDLCSDLVISFHQGVFLPLIFIGFHQKRCL